jgi:UDPglucose 6-dehydrogenase
MKVTVFGSGYVGLVSGACMAEMGVDVVCVDIDQGKIDILNSGGVPIYEPGLNALIQRNRQTGRLKFTTDIEQAVSHGAFQFIAVGTPPDEDGSADLQHVLAVAQNIAEHMSDYKIVVNKSTVPVGTADKVRQRMKSVLNQRGVTTEFDIVSNPEFLKEGAAINDFMKPDRIVVGTDSEKAENLMRNLYAPFNRNHERMVHMDIRSAELTKYAANAMLATKISFMNELSHIAERTGADIEKVRMGIGSDPRIGYQFIYPGCGYGGSCFPKDVKALERTSREIGFDAELLRAVEAVNDRQKEVLFDKIRTHFKGNLEGRKIAIWGLSFKPETDDMREAPSRVLINALLRAGASVYAYDPVAMDETEKIYGETAGLILAEDQYEALDGADALAIVTEWKAFRSPDFPRMQLLMAGAAVFDGRNIYDPIFMHEAGFVYYSIGRNNLKVLG